MALIRVDLTLGSGGNDGTTWADAYQGIVGLVSAVTNSNAGDTIYVKNNLTSIGADRTLAFPEAPGNPVKIYAVKAATSNETPVQSDLIPGLRTGDSTRAHDQTSGNAPVSISDTNAGRDFNIDGHCHWYGFDIQLDGFMRHRCAFVSGMVYEECRLGSGSGGDANKYIGIGNDGGESIDVCMINCDILLGSAATNAIQLRAAGRLRMFGCTTSGTAATPVFQASSASEGSVQLHVEGCDFSNQTSAIFNITHFTSITSLIKDTSIGSGASMITGTANGTYRIEAWNVGVNPGTPLGTGDSSREFGLYTERGEAVSETTAYRTGGSSDGESGNYSIAMTPIVNYTREGIWPMESQVLVGYVEGDGTSKTATIYIANSGAGDYDDDEVAVRFFGPSEAGELQHTSYSTVAGLLATPAVIADDAVSSWGSGAANGQKIEQSISPDYSGAIYAVVEFYKSFSSSPETLYVDGLVHVS